MNSENFASRIPARYLGYLALLLWGGATLFILRQDAYNLDEGGAKALLMIWSVADQLASSVVTFGVPDLRILVFAPAGFLWTGSVFAAKVFTVLIMALAASLFYGWKARTEDSESALIATGLLLISPLMLEQIDTLSAGTLIIATFALGAWLDGAYRANPRSFGGWYFAQLFVCALSVSLHPAGLAYPLALLWSWHREPLDGKQQKYFYIGVGFVTLFTLVARMGWHDVMWLQNPVRSLSAIVFGTPADNELTAGYWIAGGALAVLLITVIVRQFRAMWSDITGRILLIGLLLGLATGDHAFAMVALCVVLYFGFPMLLRRQHAPGGGWMAQRGGAIFLLFILSTLFMLADKGHYQIKRHAILSDEDQLIQTISEDVEQGRKEAEDSDGRIAPPKIRIASQWPSRTMIACRCDTLPLPPAAKDPETQLAMMKSVTHLLFNPKDTSNMLLARNFAGMGGNLVETVSLLPNGALLHIRSDAAEPQPSADAAAQTRPGDKPSDTRFDNGASGIKSKGN